MQITYDDLRVIYRLLYQQQEELSSSAAGTTPTAERIESAISRQLETAQNGSHNPVELSWRT